MLILILRPQLPQIKLKYMILEIHELVNDKVTCVPPKALLYTAATKLAFPDNISANIPINQKFFPTIEAYHSGKIVLNWKAGTISLESSSFIFLLVYGVNGPNSLT